MYHYGENAQTSSSWEILPLIYWKHKIILQNESEVLHKANWNSSSYLYKKRLACIAYQAYYEQTPSSIAKLFSKNSTNYNLRDNLKFELIHSNSKVLHNSFVHLASIVWNCLPTKLKSVKSYSSFRANIKKSPNLSIKLPLVQTQQRPTIKQIFSCIFNVQTFLKFKSLVHHYCIYLYVYIFLMEAFIFVLTFLVKVTFTVGSHQHFAAISNLL